MPNRSVNIIKIYFISLFTGGMIMLGGCTGPSVKDYAEEKPQMKFDEFFTGPIKAWGIVQDRSGKVVQRLDIDLLGSWSGDTGTLDEKFYYYDGKQMERRWDIKKVGPNKFTGTASDIVGEATGESSGNAIRWNYVMKLEVGNTTYDVKFDDWMYAMNDGIIVNRSYLTKFGIRVAELTLFMQKQPPQ
jgi:hypothetical protein